MIDFILIIFIISMKWTEIVAIQYQSEVNSQLVALQEVNSFLWAEGENTTARLKACEKRKKR